ncbi:MAG TPA: TetR/AcrR family transcriptional regulator [Myxococcota bacterium]|jgi:AcrR family transcriptional regulator
MMTTLSLSDPAQPERDLSFSAHSDDAGWVRAPQQARSQDTLARLLDAAEQLLEEQPWDAITVASLVHRGRSSVGAFYARFPDKDSLLQHLHARRSSDAMRSADAALAPSQWHGVSLAELVKTLVEQAAGEYAVHAGLHREIVRRNSFDPRFRERSSQVSAHSSRLLAMLLAERLPPGGDSVLAADMVQRVLSSLLDQHVQFFDRPAGACDLTDARLIDEIARLCLGYLASPSQAR